MRSALGRFDIQPNHERDLKEVMKREKTHRAQHMKKTPKAGIPQNSTTVVLKCQCSENLNPIDAILYNINTLLKSNELTYSEFKQRIDISHMEKTFPNLQILLNETDYLSARQCQRQLFFLLLRKALLPFKWPHPTHCEPQGSTPRWDERCEHVCLIERLAFGIWLYRRRALIAPH